MIGSALIAEHEECRRTIVGNCLGAGIVASISRPRIDFKGQEALMS
jgi:hypothetical protein